MARVIKPRPNESLLPIQVAYLGPIRISAFVGEEPKKRGKPGRPRKDHRNQYGHMAYEVVRLESDKVDGALYKVARAWGCNERTVRNALNAKLGQDFRGQTLRAEAEAHLDTYRHVLTTRGLLGK